MWFTVEFFYFISRSKCRFHIKHPISTYIRNTNRREICDFFLDTSILLTPKPKSSVIIDGNCYNSVVSDEWRNRSCFEKLFF